MSKNKILEELKEHAPFTFFATLIAILLVIIIKFSFSKELPGYLFNIIHPAHIFVSALVSAALFYKYKKNIPYALIVGIFASIAIGTISDVLIPWLGGRIFNFETLLHIPLFEETFLIVSTALVGSILGIVAKISKEPHFIHVLLSVFASLFYLTSFSQELNYIEFILMVLIVFVAVFIPCCFSDIIFPVFLSKNREKKPHRHIHKHNK